MKQLGVGSHILGVCAAAAALAACGGSHATVGAPFDPAGTQASFTSAGSDREQVLYSFSGGNDGGNAATGLVADSHGNLFGTTVIGGTSTCGTVFELSPRSTPPWKETVLFDFDCYATGKSPHGGVAFDSHLNLVGTTVAGGSGGPCSSDGCGVVFELTPKTEKILHNFAAGNGGFGPGGGVTFDPAGNVYGTTPDGGAGYQGTVYEIARAGNRWREKILHAFSGGKDGGVGSLGQLLLNATGDLYGVTELGGVHANGTAYRLTPSSKKLTTLYAFKGTPDAGSPYGGLTADASGNLYGTTYYGGANGVGAVFELSPSANGGYRERVIYSFKGGADGGSSTSTLVFAGSGELYGTTSAGGGSCDCGTIFKVNPKSGKESVLHSFAGGSDGAYSYYGLTKGADGTLYGTTVAGGSFNQGTVFAFRP